MSEFAVSTAASSPYDAQKNPHGVDDPKGVRITLVNTGRHTRSGSTRYVHDLDTLTVSARN